MTSKIYLGLKHKVHKKFEDLAKKNTTEKLQFGIYRDKYSLQCRQAEKKYHIYCCCYIYIPGGGGGMCTQFINFAAVKLTQRPS